MYTIDENNPSKLIKKSMLFTSGNLPKDIGAYPYYKTNGGCNLSNGKFHWELYGKTKSDMSKVVNLDWDSLRDHIKTFGVVNSMLIALMPTASTSQLLGNNECFEPYTSNIYNRVTSAGHYTIIKKYLVNDLYNLNLWNREIVEKLIAANGSILGISEIPSDIKKLYKTVWEMDQMVLINQAIDRQPFVDQSQSMNLFVRNFNKIKWNKLMFSAWKGGLKTGKYYLHTEAAQDANKFTISPHLEKNYKVNKTQISYGKSKLQSLDNICDVCSS